MSIKDLVCEMCLGTLKEVSKDVYICESCGKLYKQHITTDEEIIWLANANKLLRRGDFDDAYEEYSAIVEKYNNCYEAFFGMTLCTHGIIYVDDLLEGKKVPTCYNVAITSFLDDDNFNKALLYAPNEVKENYIEQANKIEVIRKEWLEKASKEEPFDVFISFKQSDRENGIEKTKDYYACLEIYNYLQYKCGLNVFFSPETLKNKISERYEPYIYNALNTSKVMILYGQKPEYLTSTWVKNEWIRYLRKIINHEKEQNSLIVAYEKFDAYKLPKELKGLQALDASSKDFLITLTNHINKVFEEELNKQKIVRKEINIRQINKKSTTIKNNKVLKRELGSNVVATQNATTGKQLNTISILLNNNRFEDAHQLLTTVLEKEPNNSDALYLEFLIQNKVKNSSELKDIIINNKEQIKLTSLEHLLTRINKDKAQEILSLIKDSLLEKINKSKTYNKRENCEDEILDIYMFLSHYDYTDSQIVDNKILDFSTKEGAYLKLFSYALQNLNETDTDIYIQAHLNLIETIRKSKIDPSYCSKILRKQVENSSKLIQYLLEQILLVDEGNSIIYIELYCNNKDVKYIEQDLSYSSDKKDYIQRLEYYLNYTISSMENCFDEIIAYIPNDANDLFKGYILRRYEVIKKYIINKKNKDRFNYLDKAKKYLNQIIHLDKETPDRLYELYIYNHNCATEQDLANYSTLLDREEGFLENLALFSEKHQQKILEIIEQQKKKEIQRKQIKATKTSIITISLITLLIFIIVLIISLPTIISYSNFEIDGTIIEKYKGQEVQVIIPEGTTEIADFAFKNKSEISRVIIPDTVTKIGDFAFENCTSLTSIVIPNSVRSIGDSAFYNCTSLTNITLPFVGRSSTGMANNFFGYIFGASSPLLNNLYVPSSLKEVDITGGDKIGSSAFYNCESLISIEIPDSVINIGSSAFSGCRSLASIKIPDSVTSIGDHAFSGCRSLTSIKIPDSVTSIGVHAFSGCRSLVSIQISENVTSIGFSTFSDCISLTSIEIPKNVISIGQYAFYNCANLISIEFPNSVKSIEQYAFYSCSSLISVEIPNSVKSIGYSAFSNCTSLKNVVIPDSVTSIEKDAFKGCSNLTIYCEISIKPIYWKTGWNPDNRPVIWGYKYI